MSNREPVVRKKSVLRVVKCASILKELLCLLPWSLAFWITFLFWPWLAARPPHSLTYSWSNLPKIAQFSALEFCQWNVTVSQSTTNCSVIMIQPLSVYKEYIFLLWEKKWEGSVCSSYLNVRITWFSPHNVAFTNLNLNQKLGKNRSDVPSTYNLSDRQFEDGCRCFGT